MRQMNARAVAVVVVVMASLAVGQTKKAAKPASGAPDKAHLQKIWDAWSTLDPANAAQFYASGRMCFSTSRR